VIRLLNERGAKVNFHDPYAKSVEVREGVRQRVTPLSPANLRKADLAIIVTDHSVYDYETIVRHSKLVLDTRNATRSIRSGRSKVQKL
jgi:UDP-N-acetyl-D-glucosamine dehydrogenase